MSQFLRGASRNGADAKNNIWRRLGQRCRDFCILIIAKIKPINHNLEILPLNETQKLEFVEKRHHSRRCARHPRHHAETISSLRFLRDCSERPCGWCGNNKLSEFSSLHVSLGRA
jgi:hypothetical protein